MKKLIVPAVLALAAVGASAKPLTYDAPRIPGEVVVKVRKGSMGRLLAKKSLLGAELTKTMNLVAGDYLVFKTYAKSTFTLMNELKALPEVIYAEPNFIYKAVSADSNSDSLYDKLWGLNNTGSNEPDRNGGYSGSQGLAGSDINAEKAWRNFD